MKTIAYTVGLLAAVISGSVAQAATVEQAYTFQGLLNDGSKVVTGGFTLLQDVDTQTASLESIDFTIGSTVYTTATAFLSPHGPTGGHDPFILWGDVNNPFGEGVQGTTEDFYFTFNPFTLEAWDLAYSEADPTYAVKHSTGSNLTLALAPDAGAVPEPATWAMMITGFGLAGVAMRRRARMSMRFA